MDFWNSVKGRNGVYMLTCPFFETKKANLVKIGLGVDLAHRIDSYLLYYPKGVYVFHVWLTSSKEQSGQLEKSIHMYLNSKAKYVRSDHSHTEEWFELTDLEIKFLITLVADNSDTKDDSKKKVFPYVDSLPVNELITLNPRFRTERIKPMAKSLKTKLEFVVLEKIDTAVKKRKKAPTTRSDDLFEIESVSEAESDFITPVKKKKTK